jgi:hypothetical protein
VQGYRRFLDGDASQFNTLLSGFFLSRVRIELNIGTSRAKNADAGEAAAALDLGVSSAALDLAASSKALGDSERPLSMPAPAGSTKIVIPLEQAAKARPSNVISTRGLDQIASQDSTLRASAAAASAAGALPFSPMSVGRCSW